MAPAAVGAAEVSDGGAVTYYYDTETKENAIFEDDDLAAMEWVAAHPAAVLMPPLSPEAEARYRKFSSHLQTGVAEPKTSTSTRNADEAGTTNETNDVRSPEATSPAGRTGSSDAELKQKAQELADSLKGML